MAEPRVVGTEEIREWRKRLAPGAVREVPVQLHHAGWEQASTEDGVNATLAADDKPRRTFVEPSEIIDRNTVVMLAELHRLKAMSESAFLDRVRRIKEFAGWDHLTDEQAADQLAALAAKIAAMVAEPMYHKMGKLRPVDMDRTGVGHQQSAILLPGQVGR